MGKGEQRSTRKDTKMPIQYVDVEVEGHKNSE